MAPKRTAPAAKTAPAKPAAAAAAAPAKATPALTKTAVAKAAPAAAAPAKEVVAKKTTQPQTRAQTKKTQAPVAAPVAAPEKEKKQKDLFMKKKYVPLPEELSSDDETDFGKMMDKDMAPAAPTKISKTHTEEDQENDESDDDFDDEELDRQIAQLREEFGEDDDEGESDDEEGAEKEDQEMATAKAKFIEARLAVKQAKAEGAAVDDEEDDDDEEDEDDDSDEDGTKALARHLARTKAAVPRGTIFLGNIPFGFFENEMYGYFSQFGTITNLRLLRSKKTGNSKRCAFIEFEDEKVAEIVAETTNGYIMFNRILRCNTVPAETVTARKYWKWAKLNLDPVHVPPHLLAREIDRRPKTLGDMEKILKRQSIKEKKREKKLAELGISYDFPKLTALAPKPSKRTVFDD